MICLKPLIKFVCRRALDVVPRLNGARRGHGAFREAYRARSMDDGQSRYTFYREKRMKVQLTEQIIRA